MPGGCRCLGCGAGDRRSASRPVGGGRLSGRGRSSLGRGGQGPAGRFGSGVVHRPTARATGARDGDRERRAHLLLDYRYAARGPGALVLGREGAAVRLEGHWSRYPRRSPADSLFVRRAADPPPEPGRNPFRFGLRQLAPLAVLDSADMASIVAPLDPGAEHFYRYRSGDTLSVTLPGEAVVRTVVVEAMPRYRSIRFMASLMWIEPETHGVTRVAFRAAKPIDREAAFRLHDADGWNAEVDFDLSEGGLGGRLVSGSERWPSRGRGRTRRPWPTGELGVQLSPSPVRVGDLVDHVGAAPCPPGLRGRCARHAV